MLLTPEAAKDVCLYALGQFFERRYDQAFAHSLGPLNQLRRQLVLRVALASVLGAVAVDAVGLSVVWAIGRGARPVGDLALYGGATTLLYGSFLNLAAESGSVAQQVAFLPSLFRVLDAPPDQPVTETPRPIREGIIFENVAFTYAGRSEPVLVDVSFYLAPGLEGEVWQGSG